MSSLHESTDPVVRTLWKRAKEYDENGKSETAQALLEAARYAEFIRSPAALAAYAENHPTPVPPCTGDLPASSAKPVERPDIRQLAREVYATAVAHTRSQDEADEAIDLIIQRLDDVLLGIGLGRRFR